MRPSPFSPVPSAPARRRGAAGCAHGGRRSRPVRPSSHRPVPKPPPPTRATTRPSGDSTRGPLACDRRHERGPFDIIGDVHGCADELEALLAQLGYRLTPDGVWRHPAGRTAVFVGDLVNRGPRVVDTVKLVMAMMRAGVALCVAGNHDAALTRHFERRAARTRPVRRWKAIPRKLRRSIAELDAQPPGARRTILAFLDGLASHYVLDDGRLVVAHAGLKESLQGQESDKARDFALYGESTGKKDAFGLPVRDRWTAAYRGTAAVVYGHTPIPAPFWRNRTIDIDTGCVYGGRLTALRWPERMLVSVPAQRAYAESGRPFLRMRGGSAGARGASEEE